jgi:hypothetical protein
MATSNVNVEAWTVKKSYEIAKWAEQHFKLPGMAEDMKVRTSLSPKRRTSRGGVKFDAKKRKTVAWMNFSLLSYYRNNRFTEYKQHAAHPVIGSLVDITSERAIVTLICHELAHSVDYLSKRQGSELQVTQKLMNDLGHIKFPGSQDLTPGNHGRRWKLIYAALRLQFVNGNAFKPENVNFIASEKKEVSTNVTGRKNNMTIETRKISLVNGRAASVYLFNEKIVAIGLAISGGFNIYKVTNGKLDKNVWHNHVATLPSGHGARRYIMENMI